MQSPCVLQREVCIAGVLCYFCFTPETVTELNFKTTHFSRCLLISRKTHFLDTTTLTMVRGLSWLAGALALDPQHHHCLPNILAVTEPQCAQWPPRWGLRPCAEELPPWKAAGRCQRPPPTCPPATGRVRSILF